jgi:polygalacturonase
MRFGFGIVLFFSLLNCPFARLLAQDTRPISEPVFPPTCAVYHAPPQSTSDGPSVGSSVTEQDVESDNETSMLKTYLQNCAPGQAVELALGTDASYNAFLLDPITIPPGISLIIDGGVTVYATRDPANFQNPDEPQYKCGTVGKNYPVNGGCVSFITLSGQSGIYGYGILDGQGNQPIFQASTPTPPPSKPPTWWDLITTDKKDCPKGESCQEASPQMISAGNSKGENSTNSEFIFYKFTIRNPQFHTVNLGGSNHTVWGVKIQAPWNVPNTDGFDIHASNVTVYDTTVANGDQEIAFSATPSLATVNITVDKFHGYSKGGITILGNDGAFRTSLFKMSISMVIFPKSQEVQ